MSKLRINLITGIIALTVLGGMALWLIMFTPDKVQIALGVIAGNAVAHIGGAIKDMNSRDSQPD